MAQGRDTRNDILHAAMSVISRKGYERSAIQEIAQQAGVNPLTVYRQFGTKLGLFTALFQNVQDIRLSFRQKPSGYGPEPLRDYLLALSLYYTRRLMDNIQLVRIFTNEFALLQEIEVTAWRYPRSMKEHLLSQLDMLEEHGVQYRFDKPVILDVLAESILSTVLFYNAGFLLGTEGMDLWNLDKNSTAFLREYYLPVVDSWLDLFVSLTPSS